MRGFPFLAFSWNGAGQAGALPLQAGQVFLASSIFFNLLGVSSVSALTGLSRSLLSGAGPQRKGLWGKPETQRWWSHCGLPAERDGRVLAVVSPLLLPASVLPEFPLARAVEGGARTV